MCTSCTPAECPGGGGEEGGGGGTPVSVDPPPTGGSGSGSENKFIIIEKPTKKISVGVLNKGYTLIVAIPEEEVGFNKLHVEAKNTMYDIEIEMDGVASLPEGYPETQRVSENKGKPIRYFTINSENMEIGNFDGQISFTLTPEELEGINPDSITVHRYDPKTLLAKAVETERVDDYEYTAKVDEFSLWTIDGLISAPTCGDGFCDLGEVGLCPADCQDYYQQTSEACTPNEKACIDSKLNQCNGKGTNWFMLEKCPYGCDIEPPRCLEQEEAPLPGVENYLDVGVIVLVVVLVIVITSLVVLYLGRM
jgi:hypothetical protein